MKEPFRNEFGALNPEGLKMLEEIASLLQPFTKKWINTFSQDEIFSIVSCEISLQLSEKVLQRTCKRLKEEREVAKKYPFTLWAKSSEDQEFYVEESFATLEDAAKAMNSYRTESPEDKFQILPTNKKPRDN